MFQYVFGDVELHLHKGFALRVFGVEVDDAADVQYHIVVSFVLVVAMKIPVARLVVNLHVAHP